MTRRAGVLVKYAVVGAVACAIEAAALTLAVRREGPVVIAGVAVITLLVAYSVVGSIVTIWRAR